MCLRSECQKIKHSHQEYLKNIFNQDNPTEEDKAEVSKRFWSYVKSKKKDSCSVTPLRMDEVLVSDSRGRANILNHQYCSVFTNEDTSNIPSKDPPLPVTMPEITVTVPGVLKQLQGLNPRKASGPDGISTRVLRELAQLLSKHLAEFFQHSIDSGKVPAQWKKAIVSPIFKKGDKHCAANYRPVSLTAVCCKLCEHIIAKSIMNHLEDNDLLSDNQHGFRKKRSCESQLLMFVDELAREMCDGNQLDVAVMDFSKAFDVVPHQRLLRKLNYYGIRGTSLKWIEDFLSGRSQQVVVDGMFSETAPVTSGVPQGSVLGPILFLTFINDMPECVTSRCRLFADDSIVYRVTNNTHDCAKLQDDLASLEEWERKWGMEFNPSKCNILHVSRKKKPHLNLYNLKGTVLEAVDTATYLGVIVAKDLAWNHHVHKTVSKGTRALGFIKRNIRTSYQAVKELAYNTLVRPTLEYASTVWSPHQKELIKSLEMVQRRAARYVLRAYDRKDSVTDMLKTLKWETLEERRLKARAVMGYRIIHELVKIPSKQFIPTTVNTRGHTGRFQQISARTNYYKHTFFPSFIPIWNALPPTVASAPSLEIFKKRLAGVKMKTLS